MEASIFGIYDLTNQILAPAPYLKVALGSVGKSHLEYQFPYLAVRSGDSHPFLPRGRVGTSLAFTSHMHMHIAHAINARCLTKVLHRSKIFIRSTEFIRSSCVSNRYLEHHRRLISCNSLVVSIYHLSIYHVRWNIDYLS